jgi:hypothetical protein
MTSFANGREAPLPCGLKSSDDVSVKRWLTLPERHPGRTLTSIGFVFALAFGASLVYLPKPGGRIVLGDALHHYVQLRSFVFDRDLQFQNEYIRLYGLRGNEPEVEWVYQPTATGHVRNLMPVGPAVVWAPAFLCVTAGVWVASLLGATYPFDGYGRLFQATAGFSGIAAATAGSWLAYLAAARLFEKRAAIWACLTVWLSSSALYYSLVSPAYSHAASMLAVSAFWTSWILTLDRQHAVRYGTIGLLAGFAALVRWQDAVLLIVPAADALWRLQTDGVGAATVRIGASVAGAFLAFLPQMAVWTVLYGTPLAIPQGEGFMKWGQPALVAVLFSDNHGLISWTPIVALALVGLVPLARRNPLVGLSAALFFGISWYVNAAVSDWWAGEAFGARRFVSCFPVFVLGLAALLDRARIGTAAAASIAAAFTVHTLLLLVQYQAFMHGLRHVVPYPRGVAGLWLARFRAPFDLLAWWIGR